MASNNNINHHRSITDINGSHPIPKKPKLSSSSFITASQIESEFSHHDTTVARINNGSFGSCPSSIISAQQQWQLNSSLQRSIIKDSVNAQNIDGISIVDDATTVAAIILQHIAWCFREEKFNKGNLSYYAYGAVKKFMEAWDRKHWKKTEHRSKREMMTTQKIEYYSKFIKKIKIIVF
jgi:hypothetical protein